MENQNNQAVNNQAVENNVANEPKEKTFTQKEVDALLQSNGDKRVSDALKTARAKWEEEYTQKMQEEKRLSEMTVAEREKELQKQAEEKFLQDKQEFEKQLAEFNKQKLEMELIRELEKEGLPTTFSTFLLGADTEATFNNMQTFKAEFNKQLEDAIQKHVEQALRGKAPATATTNKTMTKQEFLKMPYKERSKMLQEDPEFVQNLLNGK